MSFNLDIQKAHIELRGNIFERFISEIASIKAIMNNIEDKMRRDAAGLIGARDYRQYEGDLSADQRAKLLNKIKSDLSDNLKQRLLVIGANSLKDKLLSALDNLQAEIYRKETENTAEIYSNLMPEGVKIGIDITKKELDDLLRMPLAGLSIRDYIQKILIELYYGVIQEMTTAMIDAKTFEGGIKFGLSGISRKFDVAQNRVERLSQELVVQASNKAIMDITSGFKMRVS